MPITLPTRDLGGLAEWYAADPARWPVRPEFHADRRWYARLALTDDHEAWLLTWLPGQATELHDHGGASGAFTVLEGRITEQIPVKGALIDRGYGVGATRPFGPRHIHRMINLGTVPSISVHVYSPAMTMMTTYALDHGALHITGTEREGEDW